MGLLLIVDKVFCFTSILNFLMLLFLMVKLVVGGVFLYMKHRWRNIHYKLSSQ